MRGGDEGREERHREAQKNRCAILFGLHSGLCLPKGNDAGCPETLPAENAGKGPAEMLYASAWIRIRAISLA